MIWETLISSECHDNCFKNHKLPLKTENLKKNFCCEKKSENYFEKKKTDF